MGDRIQSSVVMGGSLSSPALRRAFFFALLLHVVAVALILTGIIYWPATRVLPVPAEMVLDVAETIPVPMAAAEPPVLERALAEIPPESRAISVSAVPGIMPAMIPEPTVKFPDQTAVWMPVPPEVAPAIGDARPGDHVPGPPTGAPAAGVRAESISSPGQAGEGRPIALAEILPHYPYGARTRGESGRVTVHVCVSDHGIVESAEVVAGSGYQALDDSAVAATMKARFKPAERDHKPVPSDMNLQFEFRLEER